MPSPKFEEKDLCQILENVIFSSKISDSKIKYDVIFPDEPVYMFLDEGQITRVFINLLKNSSDAINHDHGIIIVKILERSNNVDIIILDNGTGFDEVMINELIEPYVTTKKKGMGLGLSIVNKIVKEHNGVMKFYNDKDNRAVVSITLPKYREIPLMK